MALPLSSNFAYLSTLPITGNLLIQAILPRNRPRRTIFAYRNDPSGATEVSFEAVEPPYGGVGVVGGAGVEAADGFSVLPGALLE